ncbi:MAG: hypothetical protein M3N98_04740 [Actinomycetota bacterium]|nr:hypothetical protein [Actinomycetota bacterium]
MPRRIAALSWLLVVLVGVGVVGLVLGLKLPNRLNAGQRVINDLHPAFTPARVAGDRAGVNIASNITNLADPIVNPKGGAAAEIPQLLAFVSSKTGLSQPAVLDLLTKSFPHTTALLQTIPLSSVSAEIPTLLNLLASTLHMTQAQVLAALKANFPALTQAITALPIVTGGWDNVPGTAGLTRFDGTPVHSVPQVRDYFSADVIPVLEHHQTDFGRLDTYQPPVHTIPTILLVIAGIVILFGLLMMLRSAGGKVKVGEATVEWLVVLLVGVIVLAAVFGLQIYPRLDGGQHLLRDAAPVFQPARVSGSTAGIAMVSSIVDLADPVVTERGGAAGEVPKLIAFVSSKTGLAPAAVLSTLQSAVPHVTALLQAIPLSSVTAEVPGLMNLLGIALKASPAQVMAALSANFPHLAQAITALPVVTNGWYTVPGVGGLTRFDGKAVHTVPDVRDYFARDVIPAVVKAAPDFHKLYPVKEVSSTTVRNGATVTTTKLVNQSEPLDFFPGLLTIVGGLVVIYGIIMLIVIHLPDPEVEMAERRDVQRRRR